MGDASGPSDSLVGAGSSPPCQQPVVGRHTPVGAVTAGAAAPSVHVEATRHDAGQETGYAAGPYVPEQLAALLGGGQRRRSSCLISCTTVGGVRPGSRYS